MKTHSVHSFRRWAFTLVELMVVISMVAALALMVLTVGQRVRTRAGIAVSTIQLHELVAANGLYAADHDGEWCPAMSADNLIRWHGGRRSLDEEFDPGRGYLAPYIGGSRAIETCPLLTRYQRKSFEAGAGGYGYNAEYIGSRPDDPFRGAIASQTSNLGRVVMFATTALAVRGGVQEYPFTEPRRWLDRHGRPRGELQPTTHFRANGRAIIAWGDGRVTLESPSTENGVNFYGGDNARENVGWFGPKEDNGYWNPDSPAARGDPAATTP